MKNYFLFAAFAMTGLSFFSCKKSSDTYSGAQVSEYYPLTVGKYITYKLDSLVYINFGASSTTRTYQVKFVNDALATDAQGRLGMRVIRYIRSIATAPWIPDATFYATNVNNSIEFTDNNQRFIKLKMPIREGFSWKGNSYIDTYSLNSEVKYLADWDYTYDSVNMHSNVGTYSLDSTLKVSQRDEVIGTPSNPTFYSEYNFGEEKYAKGIGIVYRKFSHSEYQPPVPGRGGHYTDGSYGVTYTMIDHN
ncbi:MAG: hypothetical protein ABIY51_01270 [Ferruginibacter sp.]